MTGPALVPRDVLVAHGPDAESYLQGQLSQDIAGLAVGESGFSLLLQPQGKVDAWLRVTRTAADAFVLDVDAGWGEHVLARLARFLLRVQVELEPLHGWAVVAGVDVPVPNGAFAVTPELGWDVPDLLGPADALPAAGANHDYEVARIRAGVPRMGSELTESTIPAAAGVVDRSVSFTKGCYTGQELVARIDSRGDRVPFKLRRLTGDVAVGATLTIDGKDVGTVTSSAGGHALAYVRREVEPPTAAVAGGAQVVIEA